MSNIRYVIGPWPRDERILSLMLFYKDLNADIINGGYYLFIFLSRDPKDKTFVRVAKIFRRNIVFLRARSIGMNHHMRAESLSMPESGSA